MNVLRVLLVSILFSVPLVAHAQEGEVANVYASEATAWQIAFPEGAVQSYLLRSDAKVMVISVDADAPMAAFKKALDKTTIVLDSKALGDVSELSDADIVAKASNQPVDQLVIIRVAGGDENPIAVVTLYDKKGESLGGFTASASSPAPREGGGVSQSEVQSARDESERAPIDEEARDEFLDNFVAFRDWVGINQYGAVVSSWSEAFQGRDRRPLEGADFYEAVGRPDLAEEYRSNNTVKTVLGWTGGLMFLGGLTYMLVGPLVAIGDDAEFDTTPLIVGGAIAGGGIVVAIVNGTIDLHPVEPHEARGLARSHNEELAEELGIDIESLDPLSRRPEPQPDLELTLKVGAAKDGVTLGVGGRF